MYAGLHHTQRTAIKDEWRALVREAVGPDAVPFDKPVNVYTYCEMKGVPVDGDNVCDKLVIDGLVKAGVLHDDNGKWVHWTSSRAVNAKEDVVYVTLEVVDE